MRLKRDKFKQLQIEWSKFIKANPTVPFNMQTAELLLSAFAAEIGLKELVNIDEFFGMILVISILGKLTSKEAG